MITGKLVDEELEIFTIMGYSIEIECLCVQQI
jgi:hypothetical protein